MVALLVLVFLVVPIAELAVIVKVAGVLGVAQALFLLLAISVVGAWLVKRQGIGVLRRVQAGLGRGEVPHRELLDGLLILVAGALLLAPGFLTDALGLLLLLPPTRTLVRSILYRRFRNGLAVSVIGPLAGGRRGAGGVVDVDGHERGRPSPPRPELDP